jgi:hypothetical protein
MPIESTLEEIRNYQGSEISLSNYPFTIEDLQALLKEIGNNKKITCISLVRHQHSTLG